MRERFCDVLTSNHPSLLYQKNVNMMKLFFQVITSFHQIINCIFMFSKKNTYLIIKINYQNNFDEYTLQTQHLNENQSAHSHFSELFAILNAVAMPPFFYRIRSSNLFIIIFNINTFLTLFTIFSLISPSIVCQMVYFRCLKDV